MNVYNHWNGNVRNRLWIKISKRTVIFFKKKFNYIHFLPFMNTNLFKNVKDYRFLYDQWTQPKNMASEFGFMRLK